MYLTPLLRQETQLAVLGTTERALYTVQSIRKVLHYDALQKEPESYGSVWKLREAGGKHRPELDGTERKVVEYAGNYSIIQGPGSVNPYSYPCRHVRASDLWCRRQSDVSHALVSGGAMCVLHIKQLCVGRIAAFQATILLIALSCLPAPLLAFLS